MVKSKSWHSFALPAYQALPVRNKFKFRSFGLKQNLNFAIGMTSAHSLNGSWLSLGLGSPTLHKMTPGNWNGHRDTTYGIIAHWKLNGSKSSHYCEVKHCFLHSNISTFNWMLQISIWKDWIKGSASETLLAQKTATVQHISGGV